MLPLPRRTLRFARALRRTSTKAERALWKRLRNKRFHGWKFRRQHPVSPFIVDFCCLESRLVVEVDGDIDWQWMRAMYDIRREAYLRQKGFRIIRFTNRQVMENIEGVLETLDRALSLPLPLAEEGLAERRLRQ